MRVSPVLVIFLFALTVYMFPINTIPGLGWLGNDVETTRNCPFDDPYCNPYDTSGDYALAVASTDEDESSCLFFCGEDSRDSDDGLLHAGIEHFKEAIKFPN